VIAVSLTVRGTLRPEELITYPIPRMPHYMTALHKDRGRFARDADAENPQAHSAQRGITADTWDRERAGIRLEREKLSEI
jgi:hypothetical protein